jgi:Rhodanese-like domain
MNRATPANHENNFCFLQLRYAQCAPLFSKQRRSKMPRRKNSLFLVWMVSLLLLAAFASESLAKEAPRMTKEELKALMGKADVVIIDARAKGDWEGSKEKIQGAIREDPDKKTKEWANKYPKDKTLVFYCA